MQSKSWTNLTNCCMFEMSVTSSVKIAKPFGCLILSTIFFLTVSPINTIIPLSIFSEPVENDSISFTPSSFSKLNKDLLLSFATSSFLIQYKASKTAKYLLSMFLFIYFSLTVE